MGVGFGLAVQRAVLCDEAVAGKAIESLLAVSIESLGQAVGAHPRGKGVERAHEIAACLNTPQIDVVGNSVRQEAFRSYQRCTCVAVTV